MACGVRRGQQLVHALRRCTAGCRGRRALSTLTAISPLDGRYASKVEELRGTFSEFGLIRHRVRVEVAWFQMLAELVVRAPPIGRRGARCPRDRCRKQEVQEVPALSEDAEAFLRQVVDGFSEADGARVKEIEAVTNHDVKAVEYFLKERVRRRPGLGRGRGRAQPTPGAATPSLPPAPNWRAPPSLCTLRAPAKTSTTLPTPACCERRGRRRCCLQCAG